MPGSIQKRGNSSYLLTVSHGYDKTGKQQRFTKTIHAKNEKEADKQLSLFYAQIVGGKINKSSRMTFREYVSYWRENYGSNTQYLSRKTYERYNELLDSRITKAIGHLRLDEIQPTHILHFLKDLGKPNIRLDGKRGALSDRVIEMHYRLLSAMLNKAVKWNLISQNPCVRVDAPKVSYDNESIHIYDEKTLSRFLIALDEDSDVKTKYKVLVYLALITGLRRGELLGLKWSAIDLDLQQLRVKEASEYIVGQPIGAKKPKTAKSKRLLSISKMIIALLKKHLTDQTALQANKGEKWIESEYIFTTRTGGRMHVNSFHTWLQKFTAKHGLPNISPHVFRHMSATYKLQEGSSLKAVQGDLGHTRIGTTNRYTHRLETASRDATNRMEAFIERIKDEATVENDE